MTLEDQLRDTVNRHTSNVILRADVAGMGSASQVSVALRMLQKKGMLIRIGKGVYAKSTIIPATGAIVPAATLETLATETADRLGINATIQPAPPDAASKRHRRPGLKLSIGNSAVTLTYDRTSIKKRKEAVVDKVNGGSLKIPETGLKNYVLDLAKRHQITYVKTYADEWAESVTRLADDEVRTDNIENLVIALKKDRRVSSTEMVQMLANYLREKEGV